MRWKARVGGMAAITAALAGCGGSAEGGPRPVVVAVEAPPSASGSAEAPKGRLFGVASEDVDWSVLEGLDRDSAIGRVQFPSGPPGPSPEIDKVVAALRPQLARCFEKALKRDPAFSGALSIEATVNGSGKVSGLKVNDKAGLDHETFGCMLGKVRGAGFPPPPAGKVTVTIPLNVVAK